MFIKAENTQTTPHCLSQWSETIKASLSPNGVRLKRGHRINLSSVVFSSPAASAFAGDSAPDIPPGLRLWAVGIILKVLVEPFAHILSGPFPSSLSPVCLRPSALRGPDHPFPDLSLADLLFKSLPQDTGTSLLLFFPLPLASPPSPVFLPAHISSGPVRCLFCFC